MRTWRVLNLDTGEVRFVRHYDNISAIESCGWKWRHCECTESVPN